MIWALGLGFWSFGLGFEVEAGNRVSVLRFLPQHWDLGVSLRLGFGLKGWALGLEARMGGGVAEEKKEKLLHTCETWGIDPFGAAALKLQ